MAQNVLWLSWRAFLFATTRLLRLHVARCVFWLALGVLKIGHALYLAARGIVRVADRLKGWSCRELGSAMSATRERT